MQIHSLSFQAIGPFPGAHTIDFDAVGASGLFLITGPTGSGKTVLLDAICYALYGRTSRPEADPERLRCQTAPPSLESAVDVVFTVAGSTYRVRRTPPYERAARRGRGTTLQKATATLWPLDSPTAASHTPLATMPREVGHELERILPLTLTQFRQTVILPQGAFATFLSSTSDDRQRLLAHIFGTDVYARLEQELVTRASRVRRDTETLDKAARMLAHTLAEQLAAAGLERAEIPDPDAGTLEALPALYEPALARLEARRGQAESRALAAAAAAEEVRLTRREAAEVTDLASRAAQARARDEALSRVAPQIAQLAARTGAAERAAGVRPAWQTVDDRAALVAESRRALEADLAGLRDVPALGDGALAAALHALGTYAPREAGSPDVPADSDARAREPLPLQPLQEALECVGGLRDRLAAAHERADAARAAEDQIAACEAQITSREEALAAARAEVATYPDRRAHLDTRIDEARAERDRLESLAATLVTAEAREAASQRAATLTAQLADSRTRVEEAEAALARAQATQQATQQAWSADAAGSLAALLTPNSPCPVCGSSEHPRPAPASATGTTLVDLKRATDVLTEASSDLSRLTHAHGQLEAELADATAAMAGMSADTIARNVCDARTRLKEARKSAEALTGLETDREALAAAEAQIARQIAALEAEIATAHTQLSEHTATRDRLRVRLAQDAAPFDSLDARAQALDALAALLGRIRDDSRALATARSTLETDLEHARALTSQAGFDDRADAERAWLPPTQITQMREQVTAHERECAAVAEALSDPRILAAETARVPDLDALDALVEQWRARARACTAQAEAEARAARDAATGHGQLSRTVNQVRATLADARDLLALERLITGRDGSGQRTPLSTWVVQSCLDQILTIANQKLAGIAAGRYELRRSSSDGSRTANQALSIDVIDHTADGDRVRRSSSLSGGETFYCSLALALALAEAVTAQAGGIVIRSMFIDEGFGTLDDETLREVLAQVVAPDRVSRAVGIISHVAGVREHIHDRIQVTRGTGGSTVEVLASV